METALYAADLERAERFYTSVLGLEIISRFEDAVALRCDSSVLLIFDPARSEREDRSVPSHGSSGRGHVAFEGTADQLEHWRTHLAEHDVEIEAEVEWGSRGTSIYFRDPDGNLVEIAPPDLWD